MFSFEGDFKTRPKVSLGGASRKVRAGLAGLLGSGPARPRLGAGLGASLAGTRGFLAGSRVSPSKDSGLDSGPRLGARTLAGT